MAVVFYNQYPNLITPEGDSCGSLSNCYVTLMRLTLYDGTGLDYFSALTEEPGSGGYVVLLVLFMLFNAIILINGMIGIFGSTFTDSDTSMNALQSQVDAIMSKLDSISSTLHPTVKSDNSNQPSSL